MTHKPQREDSEELKSKKLPEEHAARPPLEQGIAQYLFQIHALRRREIDLDLTKRSNCLMSRDYEKLRRGIQRYFTNIKTHSPSVYSVGATRRTAPHVTSHPIKATFLSHVGSVQAIGSSQNISSSKAKQGLQTLTF